MLQKGRLNGVKKRREWYTGKKKRPTKKTQVIDNKGTREIICTAHGEGKEHDFKVYEESIGNAVSDDKKIQSGSGYQGIKKLNKNSETAKEKAKGGELTVGERGENKRISRERILIENINGKVKEFKIT